MALKFGNKDRWFLVGAHFARRLAALQQPQHTLATRRVARAPHGTRRVDSDIRSYGLCVPYLIALSKEQVKRSLHL